MTDMGGTDAPGETLRQRIRAFLAEHTTLTLATVNPDGRPSAAAVFYAADEALNLYFLSEERTEHGSNLLATGVLAGTIQADGQDWRTIRGVQLRGRRARRERERAYTRSRYYARRFAFCGRAPCRTVRTRRADRPPGPSAFLDLASHVAAAHRQHRPVRIQGRTATERDEMSREFPPHDIALKIFRDHRLTLVIACDDGAGIQPARAPTSGREERRPEANSVQRSAP